MKQEDKELLLRDLCARLPYGVICNIKGDKINKDYMLNGIEMGGCTFQSRMALYGWNSFKIKPYLRPMSSMTEEERKHWRDISLSRPDWDFTARCLDWLNSRHFDYRGLLERGLALEALEGMYEY